MFYIYTFHFNFRLDILCAFYSYLVFLYNYLSLIYYLFPVSNFSASTYYS